MQERGDWHSIERLNETDDQRLRDFGYKPQFKRVLGLFADFALGYSYMSPVAGFYALFAQALTTGGPAFLWTMPVVLLGQTLTALILAESSSQYPIAGGVYQWARRLAGPRWGFLTAWMYLLGLLGTIAGLAAGVAPYVAPLVGMDASPTFSAVAGIAVIVLAAIPNLIGTRFVARAAEAGVWSGVVGMLLCGVYLLLFGRHQPLSALALGPDNMHGPSASALLASSLIGIWIFFGHEACGDLAEEVTHASRAVPRAMLLTMLTGGGSALVIGFGMTLAIPDMALALNGQDANPADTLLRHAFGSAGANFVLACLIVVVLSATTSVIASTSRLLFSLGRDGAIFGSGALQRVDVTRGLPLVAVAVATAVPVLLVAVGILSKDAASAIISFATAAIYSAFAMVVISAVVARLGGWKPSGHFQLGVFGWPVTLLALAFGAAAIVNLCWPRPASDDQSWVLVWINAISLVAIMGTGVLQLGRARRFDAVPAGGSAAGGL